MKKVSRRGGGTAAALLGVMLAGGACSEEETGLFIMGNLRLEPPECVARAEGTSTLLISGLLDVLVRPQYDATLLVGSQLTPRGDKGNLRAETMITTITGAEVRLYGDTGELETEFTVPASGVIRPDSAEEPGFGIISATLIPGTTGDELAGELVGTGEVRTKVAKVSVFGTTIGGLDVESAPLTYVVRVCAGCLIDFGGQSVCPEATEDTAGGCHTGQDDAVPCQICAGNPFCDVRGGAP